MFGEQTDWSVELLRAVSSQDDQSGFGIALYGVSSLSVLLEDFQRAGVIVRISAWDAHHDHCHEHLLPSRLRFAVSFQIFAPDIRGPKFSRRYYYPFRFIKRNGT